MSSLAALYETDFHAWALEMAQLIKTKQFDKIDVEHLSEEVESMGAVTRNALESRLIELMQHFFSRSEKAAVGKNQLVNSALVLIKFGSLGLHVANEHNKNKLL